MAVTKNKGGAPIGNKNHEKYTTSAQRKDLLKKWVKHRTAGFSKFSFVECDEETVNRYAEKYPEDLPPEDIQSADRACLYFWEKLGQRGTRGDIKGFNAVSHKFITTNISSNFKNNPDAVEVEIDKGGSFGIKVSFE